MFWVITANASVYRIYGYDKKANDIALIHEEYHPESRMKVSDLMSDRPGHYKARSAAHGAYVSHANPHEDEIEVFLRGLVHKIEAGRNDHQFEKIIFIAPAKINGLISKHLHKEAEALICNGLKKDYTHFTQQELRQFLHDHWMDLTA